MKQSNTHAFVKNVFKFVLQKCRDVFTFVVERPIEQIDGMLSEVGVSVQTERWRKSQRM